MAEDNFKIGDYVWAKMKGYPHWPGKVVEPNNSVKAPKKKSYFIFFYGTRNFSYIAEKDIVHHSESMLKNLIQKKTHAYQHAIDDFLETYNKENGEGPSKVKEKPEGKKGKVSNKKRHTDDESAESDSNAPSESSKFDSDDDDGRNSMHSRKTKEKKFKRKRLSKAYDENSLNFSSKANKSNAGKNSNLPSEPIISSMEVDKKKQNVDDKSFSREPSPDSSISPKVKRSPKLSRVLNNFSKKQGKKVLLSKSPTKTGHQTKFQHSDVDEGLDIDFVSSREVYNRFSYSLPDSSDESVEECDDQASDDSNLSGYWPSAEEKKIGFIGLDAVGRVIVTKFLDRQFNVTLLTKEISNDLQSSDETRFYKAKIVKTPAEMVAECDIVFYFYSEPEDFKEHIFDKNGILCGFEDAEKLDEGPKGLVLLTAIDVETSKELSKAVSVKRGFYLEAPVCGTIDEAQESKLIILGSGDRKLFHDCKSYFNVISKKSMFLSSEIGYSLKMSILVNTVNGGLCTAMAEAAELANSYDQQTELHPSDISEICSHTFKRNSLIKKAERMGDTNFKRVSTSIKHVGKNMDLLLKLSETIPLAMPIASTANQVYARAKLMNYSDADVTCIYKVVKF